MYGVTHPGAGIHRLEIEETFFIDDHHRTPTINVRTGHEEIIGIA